MLRDEQKTTLMKSMIWSNFTKYLFFDDFILFTIKKQFIFIPHNLCAKVHVIYELLFATYSDIS